MVEKATRIKSYVFVKYRQDKLYLKRNVFNRKGEIETSARKFTENESLQLILKSDCHKEMETAWEFFKDYLSKMGFNTTQNILNY